MENTFVAAERDDLTAPQVSLTIELLEYTLLRLAKSCVFPDWMYDILPPGELESMAAKGQPFGSGHPCQDGAAIGALINGNTESAYNYAVVTFEETNVLEVIPLCKARRVVVSVSQLGEHLVGGGFLSHELFERAIYHFYDWHEQVKWVGDFGIPIKRGLEHRFKQAGLLDPELDLDGWSGLMVRHIRPLLSPGDDLLSVNQFFEEVYHWNDAYG
jgi:hypothetical protein